jgi:phosphoglycolate phosphatase-like HAD superfamily hydrolase
MKLAPRRVMQATPDRVLRPVVAIDIDGTMGFYHEHFLKFAAQWLQRTLPVYWDGSQPFWRTLGTSKQTYRQIKLCYRQGGMKRSMAPMPFASALSRAVRAAGAELWVCTTRPYLRLDNIDPDTRFWLRNNGIQYDGVLFGENKYRDLAAMVGTDRVVAMLDDEPEQIARALRIGLPAYLIQRTYNRDVPHEAAPRRIENLRHGADKFTKLVEYWLHKKGVK